MQGLAACVVMQTNLTALTEIPKDINVFPLFHEGVPQAQTVKLIHRRDRYLPGYAEYFIDLLTEYYHAMETVSVKRKV